MGANEGKCAARFLHLQIFKKKLFIIFLKISKCNNFNFCDFRSRFYIWLYFEYWTPYSLYKKYCTIRNSLAIIYFCLFNYQYIVLKTTELFYSFFMIIFSVSTQIAQIFIFHVFLLYMFYLSLHYIFFYSRNLSIHVYLIKIIFTTLLQLVCNYTNIFVKTYYIPCRCSCRSEKDPLFSVL